ncbi:MAG: hypothetical protein NTX88_11835 [Candidatus Atribacteria bacterium]|nr:hypothetical protein [Candidatus Atribacteria bacterium]
MREKLGQEGFHVGMVHFSELYPLPAGLDSLFQVIPNPVVIEGNFNGQLARFLEKELHVILPRRINQYNGLPFLVDDVLTRVKEVGL